MNGNEWIGQYLLLIPSLLTTWRPNRMIFMAHASLICGLHLCAYRYLEIISMKSNETVNQWFGRTDGFSYLLGKKRWRNGFRKSFQIDSFAVECEHIEEMPEMSKIYGNYTEDRFWIVGIRLFLFLFWFDSISLPFHSVLVIYNNCVLSKKKDRTWMNECSCKHQSNELTFGPKTGDSLTESCHETIY